MIIHRVLYLLALLVLVACVTNTGNKKYDEESLPQWVIKPPGDSKDTYFGVGQARDLNHAKNTALQEISAKISIFVGGSSETTSTLRNNTFQEHAQTQVTTQTQNKELLNYSIEETAQHSGQFYVLASVAKSSLVEGWGLQLEHLDRTIKAEVSALDKLPVVQQYIKWQQILPALTEATSLLLLIKKVDPRFQATSYENRYLGYNSKAREASNNLDIHVQSKTDFAPLSREFTKQLTDKGIKASASRSKQTNTVIEIKGTERRSLIYDSYTIQLRLNILVMDSAKRVITTNPINISGGSVIDYAAARISAANELGRKIEENGIFVVLGLTSTIK